MNALYHAQRKKRSDACVSYMIKQYQGLTCWSKELSVVLFGKTKSEKNRFYFECKKLEIEIK